MACVKVEEPETSDVDIVVKFGSKQKTFDNFMNLDFFLEKLFGKKWTCWLP